MIKKIKIGVIGAGKFAQLNHIPCLIANEMSHIEWICDLSEQQEKIIDLMYGIPSVKNLNLNNALNLVDIVLLTVPYGIRGEFYGLLSEKKVGVYVEKPFARSLSEHDDIAHLFRNQSFTIGFNRRVYRNHQILKKVIKEKIFGQLKKVSVRQGFFSLSGGSGFRSNARLAGGGVLMESGIHLIDALLNIVDPLSVVVHKKKMLLELGIDYHTEANGSLVMADNEIPFSIAISALQNFNSGMWFEFEGGTLFCPMSPEEKIKIISKTGGTLGKFELDVDGASTVAQSLSNTWSSYIKDYIVGGKGTVRPENVRLTSGLLGQLYIGEPSEL